MAGDPRNPQNSGTMGEPGTNLHPQAPTAGAQTGRQTAPGTLGGDRHGLGGGSDPRLAANSPEVRHVVLASAVNEGVAGEALVIRLGSIYKLEGFIDGKPVAYVGKANEIKERIGSNAGKHRWDSLVKDPKTKVSIRRVFGKPDAAASGRGNIRSAQNEALLSQEEKALRQTEQEVAEYNKNLKPGQAPKSVLNKNRPAAGENMEIWQKRHNVTSDEEWDTIKAPGSSTIVFRAFVGLQVLQLIMDALLQARNNKLARYVWAPYVFMEQDGESSFTMESEGSWWGFVMHYRKKYITGPRRGTTVEVNEAEYKELEKEGHALYGDVDFWGDFIPGLLMPEIPVVPAPFDGQMA